MKMHRISFGPVFFAFAQLYIHHITWYSHGGPTRLDNLVLLCRRHHKRLHTPGWHAKLLPDATLEVTDPTGTVRTSHPPGTLTPFP